MDANAGLNAQFAAWLEWEGTPRVSIVTGDCTDMMLNGMEVVRRIE